MSVISPTEAAGFWVQGLGPFINCNSQVLCSEAESSDLKCLQAPQISQLSKPSTKGFPQEGVSRDMYDKGECYGSPFWGVRRLF